MEAINILSSPDLNHKPGEMWRTPARSKIRGMRAVGKSYGEIKKLTGLAGRPRHLILTLLKRCGDG